MVTIATLLFVFSTMHIGVDIHRIIQGLVDNRNFIPGGPPVWFEDVSQFTFVFKSAIYSFQTITGDAVVIYRCYVVWQSIYVIIFPIMMLLGVAVTAAGSVYACSRATLAQGGIFFGDTDQWITSFYAATLSTNMLCTLLLVFRIWQINSRVSRGHTGVSLKPVLLIVMDAGVLYSVTLLSALIAFVSKSNGQFIVLDMVTPIISIAFYMVIIRVGIASVTSQRGDNSSGFTHPVTPMRSDFAMRPLEVHITQLSETQKGEFPESIGTRKEMMA
ncbi:hypothetical protein BV25DRAFT_1833279 [Artomyces pyxidatus]|uniref:Uncharacterized protein n=1 Tax=Artomyces pyxidatus TaxID=48021 RepID=A0ACB8SH77_9AGAM|nr:hypothetical protein BV25DRAFT_1833279 [Artomyces pyxidatus]